VESINALPIFKFKLKNNENVGDQDANAVMDEGGILAAGTEKERAISGEDAVSLMGVTIYIVLKLWINNIYLKVYAYLLPKEERIPSFRYK